MNQSISGTPTWKLKLKNFFQEHPTAAYRSVNSVMVKTYWQIGKCIVKQEQHGKARANYGEYLIVNLSRYLTDSFSKGFTEANIRNIRQFYSRFSNFDLHRINGVRLEWH
ncbi:DUF1016 N-terminal domain-containing protein [Legionella shakespearei]|uniref:DUF1016 N-terminal domain-containing protein n=1 Tax=Legionella shakespearei TaxID=45075 RepID=UPI000364DA25|nr:DUF1016 N-terminal domain-containing protein [Legionella shakespearei]